MKEREVGRLLCYILRHCPECVGIQLDHEGYALVSELLEGMGKYKGISLDILSLEAIVTEDSKQRYAWSEGRRKIRANQGHSVSVDVGLERKEPPPVLFHGTAKKYVESIEKEGLTKRTRLYVHLSSDVATAISVGVRHGEVCVFEVDAESMVAQGMEFYQSVNQVWLTEFVPVSCLRRRSEMSVLEERA